MNRRTNCHGCSYYRELKRSNGSIRCYCNDRDCTVDPYEPACNYD